MPEGVGGVNVGSWASRLGESEALRQPQHESEQKSRPGRQDPLLQGCRDNGCQSSLFFPADLVICSTPSPPKETPGLSHSLWKLKSQGTRVRADVAGSFRLQPRD